VLLFLLVGIAFLFGPFRSFFSNFVNAFENFANKSTQETSVNLNTQLTGGPLGGPPYPAAASSGGKSDENAEPRPFAFINEINIDELIFLAKKEPVESVIIIASYLNSLLASKLIAAFDRATQGKIAQELSQMKEKSADAVKSLEKKIKEKVEFTVGGEHKLQQIMNYTDAETQQSIMQSLRAANPAFAEQIKKQMFAFEQLASLDTNTIQMLIRNINPTIFAQVLKSMPADFQKKILQRLPAGLSERLEQEMTMGKPLAKKRIEDEKKVIIQLVKSFEQQGLIDLSKIG
jgi:flagellar motor switch protein FliG